MLKSSFGEIPYSRRIKRANLKYDENPHLADRIVRFTFEESPLLPSNCNI
nr:hypothetical protein [Sphingobacterium sp.]